MASLTIKGIPDSLLHVLRRRAEQNRRSLNSEVLQLLESSTGAARVDPDGTLARIHRLRERSPLPALSDEELLHAIDEGRP